MKKVLSITFLIIIFLCVNYGLTGCGTTSKHHLMGENMTVTPAIDHIATSAKNAFLDPHTWFPLATAALLHATDSDVKIQQWAVKNTPVFGSPENAVRYSNYFLNASPWIYAGSLIITPGGDSAPQWFMNKGKSLAIGTAAVLTTQTFTSGLKNASNRERPDGSNYRSFPSGHTSAVAVSMTLSSRNIEYLDLDPTADSIMKLTLNGMTLATGWARVEGNKHYPTDILFGAALGNFVGAFLTDAFIGRYSPDIQFNASISRSASSLYLSIMF